MDDHTQLGDLAQLARAFPATPIVLDHVGGPISTAAARPASTTRFLPSGALALASWRNAQFHLHIKLGELGMRMFRLQRARRRIAAEFGRAGGGFIDTCIAWFFRPRTRNVESNFPVDKGSCGYTVLSRMHASKRIARGCSAAEKQALSPGTATQFYRLQWANSA